MKVLTSFLSFFTFFSLGSCSENENYIYYQEVDLYYKIDETPLNWYDAIAKCAEDNAFLALPRNEDEAKVLLKIFNEYSETNLEDLRFNDSFLLGFHDIFKESEFIALNGEPLKNYYNNMSSSRKIDHDENDCGAMHSSGVLEEFLCNVSAVFICQKYTRNLKDDTTYTCSVELGKCYKVHSTYKNWADAREICANEGGHLAIIKNKKEYQYIVDNYSKGTIFIGLHDQFKEGHYITVLGQNIKDIGYVSWAEKQPNGGENENCVGIITAYYKYRGFHDVPCENTYEFLCERPAPVPTPKLEPVQAIFTLPDEATKKI